MSQKAAHPEVRPVIVRWLDSVGTSGWAAKPGGKFECTTVGHLVRRDKAGVVVAMNRSHYSVGELIEIPACSIKSVRRLKE